MRTSSLDQEPGIALAGWTIQPEGAGSRATIGTIVLESLALDLAALAATLLLWPDDAGLRLSGPHLIWIAVLILAARYGTRGFLVALPLASGILVAAAAVRGDVPALTARLERAADLAGLTAAALISWVASEHQRRRGDLAASLRAARLRARADQSTMDELQSTLLVLRARTDRLKFSLTFLRRAAQRLESDDPQAAAAAALEIASARLGARMGIVQIFAGDAPQTLASVGPWSTTDCDVRDLRTDRAIAAALRTRRGARAIDLVDAGPHDVDLAAPLLDPRGQPFGVIAARGVPFGGASLATLKDLTAVANWLASGLNRSGTITVDRAPDCLDAPGADLLFAPYLEIQFDGEPMPYLEIQFGGEPMPYLEINFAAEALLEKARADDRN